MVLRLVWSAYNQALLSRPILTKSLTSGFMYASGDILCQAGLSFQKKEEHFVVDWKRAAVMGFFGTFISGPMYHYWFAYLNTLPIRMLEIRKHRQRFKILRAYSVLKKYNIKVGQFVLPEAIPYSDRIVKTSKIILDQLVFSTVYTGAFFMGVGILNGIAGVDSGEHVAPREVPHPALASIPEASSIPTQTVVTTKRNPETIALLYSLHSMKTDQNKEIVERVMQELEAQPEPVHLDTLIKDAWEHTKNVYWQTYIADCIVWPPLQLVNFTFVPLRFQVLYVNLCNLFWNAFLSFMANDNKDDKDVNK
eukprot:TRINITY_DN11075_c0_g1_i1.p1 TRINITY_DN11075_c0_g1~~TRINITY_DN11075_c0_g1_i1.p1  ORF type:complete len:308 (-),score=53.55 TRINITY_DN11075_c0_g1_i1:33-956(-)